MVRPIQSVLHGWVGLFCLTSAQSDAQTPNRTQSTAPMPNVLPPSHRFFLTSCALEWGYQSRGPVECIVASSLSAYDLHLGFA